MQQKVKVLIAQYSDKSGFSVVKVYTDPIKATEDCDMLRDHGANDKDYILLDSELDISSDKIII